MERQTKYVVIGSGAALAVALYLYQRWRKERIPTEWEKVGTLKEILCYPVKSCGPVLLKEAECTLIGLKSGSVRDRVFMVTTLEGKFITARQYPKMTQIFPVIENNVLTLKADGMPDVRVDMTEVAKKPTSVTYVFQQPVDTADCGDEVGLWLSRYILNADNGLRLSYYVKTFPTREILSENRPWKTILRKDVGALPDCSSFSLISLSSVNDLNTRLSKPANPGNFRNNFVIEGAKPYAEDEWKWVKIGDVVFRNIKPNLRCVMITVDPDTGIKDDKAETLNALKAYRQLTDKNLRRAAGSSPMMAIHLGGRIFGNVKVGDSVYASS